MKVKLITNLKSRVILVNGRIFDYQIEKNGIWFADENKETTIIEGKWQLISTLKDLTDSDCEGLVESKDYTSYDLNGIIYDKCYKNYHKNIDAFNLGYCVFDTAKERILSRNPRIRRTNKKL